MVVMTLAKEQLFISARKSVLGIELVFGSINYLAHLESLRYSVVYSVFITLVFTRCYLFGSSLPLFN
ncbi:hypothetical protein L2E82_51701 [Cichorium intybus]|nr:hypothetical protein L2E82_51701 [Cichorium intybus]